MAAADVNLEDEDEWELIDDAGFVYKRKKRRHVDPSTATTSNSAYAPPPPSDPVLEEKSRRRLKKTALLKLKEKYQREIHRWENLSNSLSEMQKKSSTVRRQPQPEEIEEATNSSDLLITSSDPLGENSTRRRLVDELLSQAEAQEMIIHDVSNLCNIAEALCCAKEERFQKLFMELPIWESSPRELLKSLCED